MAAKRKGRFSFKPTFLVGALKWFFDWKTIISLHLLQKMFFYSVSFHKVSSSHLDVTQFTLKGSCGRLRFRRFFGRLGRFYCNFFVLKRKLSVNDLKNFFCLQFYALSCMDPASTLTWYNKCSILKKCLLFPRNIFFSLFDVISIALKTSINAYMYRNFPN